MADKEGVKPGKWGKRQFVRVRRLAVGLIVFAVLLTFCFPQATIGGFNYLSQCWGDFQYQGGWYYFDEKKDDTVWYAQTGFFQRDVVVPATVNYKGQTYRVEGVGPRVTVYETQKENIVRTDAYGFLLRSFVISEGVTSLSFNMLMYSYSVEYVEIPGTCKVLGETSFSRCGNLREVVLGEGVEVIETSAFVGAGRDGESLKVDIPDSVQYIGGGHLQT